MNRRELLLGLAAGGTLIAGELWFPGKKLISIPKPRNIMTMDARYFPNYGNMNWLQKSENWQHYMSGSYRKLDDKTVEIISHEFKWSLPIN